MEIRNIWRRTALFRHELISAFFPPVCRHCQAGYEAPAASVHFRECLDRFPDLHFPELAAPYLCETCRQDGEERIRRHPEAEGRSLLVLPSGGAVSLVSGGVYTGALRNAIHGLKYQGHTWPVPPLGLLLLAVFVRSGLAGTADMILPMPLHIRRFRKRGFNQAYLPLRFWRKIAADAGLALSPNLIRRDILFRTAERPPQVKLHQEERRANVAGIFSVRKQADLAGSRVVLADDVVTTGATSGECAEVLLRAGAVSVSVLVMARTPREPE
ncbi:MAG: hypothetical protein CSB33_02270 [Desulfobacterales bacterium]|nr:MAG: hypothetical protein CSB33_02270 [Desulfobacterales bacterium]